MNENKEHAGMIEQAQPAVNPAEAAVAPPPHGPDFDALHAVTGICARLPDGRLALLFADAGSTRCVGVTLADDEMVSQLHTAIVQRLVRTAGATLH